MTVFASGYDDDGYSVRGPVTIQTVDGMLRVIIAGSTIAMEIDHFHARRLADLLNVVCDSMEAEK